MARAGRSYPNRAIIGRAVISTSQVLSRSVSDAAPATETLTRAAQAFTRPVTDTAAATESLTRQITFARSVTDSAPATDVLSQSPVTKARSVTDSAPATETLTRSPLVFARPVTDSAPATESLVWTYTRLVTDSAPATDTVTRVLVLVRVLTDTAPAVEALVRSPTGFTRTVTDTAPAVDTTVRALARFRSLTDTAPATDTITTRTLIQARTITDTAPATETLSTVLVGAGIPAVVANQNWPAMGFEVDFANGPPSSPGSTRRSVDATYRRVTVRSWTVDRGRAYELDQVQAGVATLTIIDPLENLNPDNPGSPFNAGSNDITPYRAMWVWAMWPNQPGTGNIINTGVNTSYDPSFESGTGFWTPVGGTTTAVQSTAQHFDGTHSLLVTQSAAGASFGISNLFRTVPGLTYTFSCYVYLTGGVSVTVQVVDANGNTRTGTPTAIQGSWVRINVAWTAVDTLETVTIYGTGVTTPTYYVDATMLEFGTHVGTYTNTGPVLYPVFVGYVERFPTTYDMAGFRATRPLYGVDALAVLSRTGISQSYTATITGDSPSAYAPLSNSKQATSGGALSTGSETARINSSNITGNPVYHPSASGNINWGGDTQPDGTPAVVLAQNNPFNPLASGHFVDTYPHEQQTVFDVLPAGITLSNVGGTVEVWARFTSGVVLFAQLLSTAVHGGGLQLELGYGAASTQNHIDMYTGAGRLAFRVVDGAAGFSAFYNVSNFTIPNSGFPDGAWHYYAITFYNASGSPGLAFTYDNLEFVVGAPTVVRTYGFTNLHSEAITDYGDAQSQVSLARFAVYPRDIGSTARRSHYQRGIGYLGELSGDRVARLLNQYWDGNYTSTTGVLTMASDTGYNGRALLDVLQEIQESERGLIYTARDGTVIFEDRSSRYTQGQTALWVFGENPTGASPVEYPYHDYAPDLDPTYTFSQANLTRPLNSNFAPVVNLTTQNSYGQRILTQEVQCNTDFDLSQAGIFYTQRYSTPVTRIEKLTLNPAANPSLWPVVLSLELSQRVTVRRRNAGVTVARDYYLEKISHRVNAETSTWLVDLQMSPVFVTSAWVLGDSTYGVLGTTTTPVY